MEIKHNCSTIVLLGLISSSILGAYDARLVATLGFQTKGQYLAMTGSESYKTFKHHNQLMEYLNFNHPDIHWIELLGDVSLIPDYFSLQPFIQATASNYMVKTGLKAMYDLSPKSHVFDCYLSFDVSRTFMQQIKSTGGNFDFQYHVSLLGRMPLANNVSGYASFSFPLAHSSTVVFKKEFFELINQPQISVGVNMNIWPNSSESAPMERVVIKEPIAIPVVDLVLETDELNTPEKQEVAIPMMMEETDQIAEIPEAQGWFGWLWEYIARLFRF